LPASSGEVFFFSYHDKCSSSSKKGLTRNRPQGQAILIPQFQHLLMISHFPGLNQRHLVLLHPYAGYPEFVARLDLKIMLDELAQRS
jgi:hypothetical protein